MVFVHGFPITKSPGEGRMGGGGGGGRPGGARPEGGGGRGREHDPQFDSLALIASKTCQTSIRDFLRPSVYVERAGISC